MEDGPREVCSLCLSPVNPGAVTCARCGARKVVHHATGWATAGIVFNGFFAVGCGIWALGSYSVISPMDEANRAPGIEWMPWAFAAGSLWFAYSAFKSHKEREKKRKTPGTEYWMR